jgi:transcriptional regulator with XRE-family HTH domain
MAPPVSLGERITAYRRRGRGLSSVSQEALALGVGTTQGHISRIEGNLTHPNFHTLIRICHALGLAQDEREELIQLAGYGAMSSLPGEPAIYSIVSNLGPILDGCLYPATINDDGERCWYWNGLCAPLLGPLWDVATREEFFASRKGRYSVEVLFELYNKCYPFWKVQFEKIDQIVLRHVVLFARACRIRPHEQLLTEALARMKENPKFLKVWQQSQGSVGLPLLSDHDSFAIRCPPLRFHIWRTRWTLDERFFVTHFTPSDRATRVQLEKWGQFPI